MKLREMPHEVHDVEQHHHSSTRSHSYDVYMRLICFSNYVVVRNIISACFRFLEQRKGYIFVAS